MAGTRETTHPNEEAFPPDVGGPRRLRHLAMRIPRAALIVAMIATGGCGSSSPTSPSSAVTLFATWSGPLRDPALGTGTVRLSFDAAAQDPLRGGWTATFQDGTVSTGYALASPIRPTTSGISLMPEPKPTCDLGNPDGSIFVSYQLMGVNVTSTRLTANLVRLTCAGFGGSGSVELSRE